MAQETGTFAPLEARLINLDEELQKITDMGGFIAYIERKIAEKG